VEAPVITGEFHQGSDAGRRREPGLYCCGSAEMPLRDQPDTDQYQAPVRAAPRIREPPDDGASWSHLTSRAYPCRDRRRPHAVRLRWGCAVL